MTLLLWAFSVSDTGAELAPVGPELAGFDSGFPDSFRLRCALQTSVYAYRRLRIRCSVAIFVALDFDLSRHPASNEQASKAAKNQNGAHAFPILLSLSGVVSCTTENNRDFVVGYRQAWS